MSDIRDAGPRLRQMNDVLEQNERLIGRLAWTERERDSLRRSIKNLAAYVAELNAEIESLRASVCPEPYAKSDEKRVLYDTERAVAIAETIRAVTANPNTTPPRNGALSGCETVLDPDSRVWETPCTPPPHSTPSQGSVQGEGSFRDSRNAKEPVAWAVFLPGVGTYELMDFQWEANAIADAMSAAEGTTAKVLPLYRHPQPTLTDAEREAIKTCVADDELMVHHARAATLRKLLERL